jgi:hypothetical protein
MGFGSTSHRLVLRYAFVRRKSEQNSSLQLLQGRCSRSPTIQFIELQLGPTGPVAELVGIEGGVVSGVFNLESPGVGALGRRPRHEEGYHDA